MAVLQGLDGELRILEYGESGTSYYLEVLFCSMDFTGPVSRPKTEETLVLNRGTFDTDSHYVEGSDEAKLAPLPVTFSARLADTTNSQALSDWVSGVTTIQGKELHDWRNHFAIGGVSVPAFADPSKVVYRLEMLWDGTNDYGLRYDGFYFKPGECTVNEAADSLTLNVTGEVYGDVSRITAFSSGWTSLV